MSLKYLEVPFEVKAENIAEDGTFSGWGSLFDSEPDAHRDLVARGAFHETLVKGGRNKTGIAMLWQHDSRGMPPGVWTELREDPKGLYVKGQLALDTQIGKDAHAIMLLGAKTGMWRFSLSIGYDDLESEEKVIKVGDAEMRIRLLKKVELWEISIVNFPAKLGATVTDVKQIDIDRIKAIDNERDLEAILRESGLSKTAAQYLVKLCKPSLREAKVEENDNGLLSGILGSLTKTNEDLTEFNALATIQKSLVRLNSGN